MAELPRSFDYRSPFHVAVLQPQSKIGLASSPFARRYWGNHYCFLFLQVLRCFNSLGFFYPTSAGSNMALPMLGFPIRISPDLCLFTTPRGVSPLTASFISCMCQGIHRTLFITWSPMIQFLKNCFVSANYLIKIIFRLLSYYLYLTIKKDNIYLLFGFQRTNLKEVIPSEPNRNIRRLFLNSFSLERRWSIPTF